MLAIYGPLDIGTDDVIRRAVESRKQIDGSAPGLTVLLDTGGGFIEIVARIVDTIRRHYEVVDFVVPNGAYSAGTVLAMSGDSIHMDYYSRLGPIDPQVMSEGGMVPALGYLRQYEDLLTRAREGDLSIPEIQVLLGFDQAELYKYEHERELSVALLTEWLARYKFKDWVATETRGVPVSDEMRHQRAEEIARSLNDIDLWHTHGRGISAEVLRERLKLKIDDFEDRATEIRHYHELLTDYMARTSIIGVIHARTQFLPYHTH